MILITVLLALFCERLLANFASWRNTRLFMPWIVASDRLLTALRLRAGGIRLLFIVLLPVILIGWLQYLPLGRLSDLALAFLVLLLTLGPRDLGEQVSRYLAAQRSGDEAEVEAAGYELLGRPLPDDAAERTPAFLDALFIRACERVIALLFWFVLLGPAGALLYRLTCAATGSAMRQVRAQPVAYAVG